MRYSSRILAKGSVGYTCSLRHPDMCLGAQTTKPKNTPAVASLVSSASGGPLTTSGELRLFVGQSLSSFLSYFCFGQIPSFPNCSRRHMPPKPTSCTRQRPGRRGARRARDTHSQSFAYWTQHTAHTQALQAPGTQAARQIEK